MNTEEIYVGASILAMSRELRMSPGAISKCIIATPSSVRNSIAHICDWLNENAARKDFFLSEDIVTPYIKTIEQNLRAKIRPCIIGMQYYPEYLQTISDPPPILYVKGNLDLLQSPPGVAVVGTRKASKNGIVIAERVSTYFAYRGWTIVSGLAMGIDAAAHRGALSANGHTIAVLAHGLRSASPKVNSMLGQDILDHGGAWVSEHSLEVSARRDFFVHRNRIQIGLSAGSIIIEGEERSGTMTQADYCIQNNRKLYAILPSNAEQLNLIHSGTKMLVNTKGATALRSKDDYDNAAFEMQKIQMAAQTA